LLKYTNVVDYKNPIYSTMLFSATKLTTKTSQKVIQLMKLLRNTFFTILKRRKKHEWLMTKIEV